MKKHNHLPFNDWLLSEDPLSPEQSRQLQDHLQDCQECSKTNLGLSEVKFLFRTAGQVQPADGFSVRWQERLMAQQEERMRRNAWIFFYIAAGMAVFILVFLLWSVFGQFDSPAVLLTSLVYLWTFSQVAMKELAEILRGTYFFIPSVSILGLIFFTGFCSMVSVLWLVTVRKIRLSRRAT